MKSQLIQPKYFKKKIHISYRSQNRNRNILILQKLFLTNQPAKNMILLSIERSTQSRNKNMDKAKTLDRSWSIQRLANIEAIKGTKVESQNQKEVAATTNSLTKVNNGEFIRN